MSSFRFEAEIDGSELESFVESVINNTIDYEMIANEVVKEINISEDMLDHAVKQHLDYSAIADEVDIDSVCENIINNYMSDIQDALDLDYISENVLERVDITELTNDVMNEMDIQDEIALGFNNHLEESLSGFDPEERTPLNIAICNVVKDSITYLSKNGKLPGFNSGQSRVIDQTNVVTVDQTQEKSFTPDDLLAIVSSCVVSSMYGLKSNLGMTTDELLKRSISSLPDHIRNFIEKK